MCVAPRQVNPGCDARGWVFVACLHHIAILAPEAGRVSPVNMADIKTEGRRLRKSS